MRDYADALEQAALFEHWPCSPNDATDDRIVTFGEVIELLKELAPHIWTQIVETRAEHLLRDSRCIVADVAKYSVFAPRRQWIAE